MAKPVRPEVPRLSFLPQRYIADSLSLVLVAHNLTVAEAVQRDEVLGRPDDAEQRARQDGRRARCPLPKPASYELAKYDAVIMGVQARVGTFLAQQNAFWDLTSGLWVWGALAGTRVS
ncbi:hypothetical protein C8J57DRAFT_1660896 [Mycena rebaudengoi]|nr:hypothetical protein C8J57DRAFT_1660896 [Mycena rebaudengoi]